MADAKTFLIRIWFEYSEIEDAKPQLRGVIKNAASGQQNYINNTDNIHHFIQPHLPQSTQAKHQNSLPSTSQRIKR